MTERERAAVDFDDYSILSYGGGQDGQPSNYQKLEEGRTLRLWGSDARLSAARTSVNGRGVVLVVGVRRRHR